MTYLHNLLLFQNIHFYVDPLLKYDEDGYPIEDDELLDEEYPEDEDPLEDLYEEDDLEIGEDLEDIS